MNKAPLSSIKNLDLWKAFKIILSLNYNYRVFDIVLSPLRVEWYLAVQFRNDDQKRWHPRIIVHYPQACQVAILTQLYDPEPTWISAETILAMAEMKSTTPGPDLPSANA